MHADFNKRHKVSLCSSSQCLWIQAIYVTKCPTNAAHQVKITSYIYPHQIITLTFPLTFMTCKALRSCLDRRFFTAVLNVLFDHTKNSHSLSTLIHLQKVSTWTHFWHCQEISSLQMQQRDSKISGLAHTAGNTSTRSLVLLQSGPALQFPCSRPTV